MLSKSSKQLKLYRLIDKNTGQESFVYLLEHEANTKNTAFKANGSPKRYELVNVKVTKLSK